MTVRPTTRRGSRARARLGAVLAGMAMCGVTALATGVTYGAFKTSTVNGSNSFATGSVALADNDAGTAMLSLSSARAGATDTGCIRLTYTGTLASEVRHFATVSGALASQLTLRVTRGTQSSPSFDSCTGFQADARDYYGKGAGVIYDGPLSGLPAGYEAGIVDPTDTAGTGTPTAESWDPSEVHTYRYAVTLAGDASNEGQTAAATFRWEARNR